MKINHLFISAMIAVTLVVTAFVHNIEAGVDKSDIDGIWKYEMEQAQSADYKDFYESCLVPAAGIGADWFVIYLKQYGIDLDYSEYNSALDKYLQTEGSLKATDYERIGLVKACLGYDEKYIIDTVNNKTGTGGIMSTIYGLMLAVSNDYVPAETISGIADSLVSMQMADGGWNLGGAYSDADVTAMALQALASARSYGYEENIQKGIDRLAALQRDDAGYASYGVNNSESTAQVLMALCALNIDYRTDKRFIKNGHTVLDALMSYRTSDGAFSHTMGTGANKLATVQALGALICARGYEQNGGFVYRYGRIAPAASEPETKPEPSTAPQTVPSEETSVSAATKDADKTTAPETTEDETTGSEEVSESETEVTTAFEQTSESEACTAPDETHTTEGVIVETDGHGGITGSTVKHIIIASIIGISLIALIIMAAFRKINAKRAITTGIICAVLVTAAALSRFETVKEHYGDANETTGSETQIVIRGYDDIILDTTTIYIQDGSTVFDQLKTAVAGNHINIDYSGSEFAGTIYVKSIAGLSEFDYGSMSGWTYYVNGVMPDVSCAAYDINDGDLVEWVYTDGGGL